MYIAKPVIASLREHAIEAICRNHELVPSKSVVNGTVLIHKDTKEPCALNPCNEVLRAEKLGINIGDISWH